MHVFAETERLIIREIVPSDAEGFFELDSDPEVHRYLGNKPIKDIRQAEEVIALVRQQYIDNGIGRWAMVEKSSNRFIGWTGLKLVRQNINNHENFYDLGYRLIRKYWGQGYATESAIASLEYGFRNLALENIYANAHIENQGSNNVLKKVGFQYRNEFIFDGDRQNWYDMNKSQWEEGQQLKAKSI